ncbi:hypothetical protein F8154_08325 [Alkaliphilus pronyensis]|uniref:Uncharacterized protein n=1 Tax=Alkaliphilus pronyensis TaxID=1482732 RepID=A0A6I0FFI1_9FIRM|nr:hypothetical protein [Alkaliphilus pronyensis]KAB3534721.1 hypothetical protein F8154_08325 [Alkaliphilus pronyensis]
MAEEIKKCKSCKKEFNISDVKENKSLFKTFFSNLVKSNDYDKKNEATDYCPECLIEDANNQIRQ